MRHVSFYEGALRESKPPKVRGRFLWWTGGLLFAALVVVGGTYLLFHAEFLKATVAVSGMRLTDESSVLKELIANRFDSGALREFMGPDNVLFWYFGGAEDSLASLLPAIQSEKTRVNVFARSVTVDVTERTLVGVWCVIGGECYGFDKDGVIFMSVPETSGSLILRVTDENPGIKVPGQRVLPEPDWLGRFLTAIEAVKGSLGGIAAVTVHNVTLHEWRLTLAKLSYIDFRVPNRIYYK